MNVCFIEMNINKRCVLYESRHEHFIRRSIQTTQLNMENTLLLKMKSQQPTSVLTLIENVASNFIEEIWGEI